MIFRRAKKWDEIYPSPLRRDVPWSKDRGDDYYVPTIEIMWGSIRGRTEGFLTKMKYRGFNMYYDNTERLWHVTNTDAEVTRVPKNWFSVPKEEA